MTDSCKSINRVFSRKLIEDLINKGNSPIFDTISYFNNSYSNKVGTISEL